MGTERKPARERFSNPYYDAYPEGNFWANCSPVWGKAALLVIDVQKHYENVAREVKDMGNDYFYNRLYKSVIPNSEKLLSFFRENDLPVAYANIGNWREDGRDRSPTQARPGWNYTLLKIGSKNQEVVDALKPAANDVMVYKTTDSAVNGTQIGHILRWMGIEHVIAVGIFTDQCVGGTVRDLSDWGFNVYLVEDATSALTPEIQEWETKILNQIYCKVVSTDEILDDLKAAKPE